MSTIEDIVSCFILTQDVDKHAFKFTIQTSPGRVPMYICVVLPLALTLRNFWGTCHCQLNGAGAYANNCRFSLNLRMIL